MEEQPKPLSTRMIHSMEILQMSLVELERRVDRELDRIPALEYVKHDKPKPETTADVKVTRSDDGELSVDITPLVRRLQVRDDFRPDPEVEAGTEEEKETARQKTEWINKQRQKAEWFIEAVDQRSKTLCAVVTAVLKQQNAFLESGDTNDCVELETPSTADSAGVASTTINRIQGTLVEFNSEVSPLWKLLGRDAEQASGSPNEISEAILRLIDEEDKSAPFNDEQLVRQLKTLGHDVARRTVTKYRKRLDIPSSRMRKRPQS